MFLEYYNLLEQPFGVSPDTRFLYLNQMYREALASLWYGLKEERGFMALLAEPGMGKTTLLFQLLQRLRTTSARTVFLFQTCCDSSDLIRYLLQDLGIHPAQDLASMHYQLNEALLREASAGRKFVLVIDEAQNLSEPVLESIRLLSDFETSRGKLLQIILAGQRRLINTLLKPETLQLTQRLSVAKVLDPLDSTEVAQYVRHRLGMAGHRGKPLFTPDALRAVAQQSGGVPRNINNICFSAMSTAFALGLKSIGTEIVEEVAGDQNIRLLGKSIDTSPPRVLARGTSDNLAASQPARSSIWRRICRPDWIGRYARVAASLLLLLAITVRSAA
jgi:general secretion pathway protein A